MLVGPTSEGILTQRPGPEPSSPSCYGGRGSGSIITCTFGVGGPDSVVGVPIWDNAELRGGSSYLTLWSSLSPKSVKVPIFPGAPGGCETTPECPSFVLGDAWLAQAVSQKDQVGGWWSRWPRVRRPCILPFAHSRAAGETDTVFPGVNRPPGSHP